MHERPLESFQQKISINYSLFHHFSSSNFVRFLTLSSSLLGVCLGIWSRAAISPLNHRCVRAFLALHRFLGLATSRFLSRSTPSGLSPNSPLGMISCNLLVGYFLPMTQMWFLSDLISGQDSSVGEPTSLKMRSSCQSSVLPLKSASRRTSSAMMQPTDQTSSSTEQLYSPRRSSGGRYHMVMTSWVMRLWVALRASPKSQILRMPSLEQRRLEVLRSRWTILRSWRQAMPSSRSRISRRTWLSLNCTAFSSSLTSWSKYSITIYTLSFSLEPATRVILMMLGWSRLRRMAISRSEVIGKSEPSTSFSFLIARMRPVGISTARQTTPYCPSWILLSRLQQLMSSQPSRRQHRFSDGPLASESGCSEMVCYIYSRERECTRLCVCYEFCWSSSCMGYLSIIRAHCRPIQIIHDQTHQVPARFLDRLLAGRGRRHRALLRLLPARADRLLRAQGQLLQSRHQSTLLHARALQHGRGVLLHPLPQHQAVPHRQPRDRHQQEPAETGSHLLALLPARPLQDILPLPGLGLRLRQDPHRLRQQYHLRGLHEPAAGSEQSHAPDRPPADPQHQQQQSGSLPRRFGGRGGSVHQRDRVPAGGGGAVPGLDCPLGLLRAVLRGDAAAAAEDAAADPEREVDDRPAQAAVPVRR